MIENKELGLKVAENPQEEIWNTIKDNTQTRINNSEIQIEVDKIILQYASDKLKEFVKA